LILPGRVRINAGSLAMSSSPDLNIDHVAKLARLALTPEEKAKGNPSLQAAGERLTTHLGAVEEDLYQVRNRSNQDPLNFPIKLNNQLAALMRVIGTGDGRPTDQSYEVFKELSAELDVQLSRLKSIEGTELGALNKLLTAKSAEPIRVGSK